MQELLFPLLRKVAISLIALMLLLPLFMKVAIGVQLIVNAGAIVTLGAIESISIKKKEQGDQDGLDRYDDDEGEDDEVIGMKDALTFPLVASASLLGIYFLVKIFNKELIAYVLRMYFSVLGTHCLGLFFGSQIKHRYPETKVVLFDKKINIFSYEIHLHVTQANLAGYSVGILLCGYYFLTNWWLLNNVIGIAFTITGIKLLKYTNFRIGLLVLWGLFFYDIWWVFYTDVMVSVAKSVDGPILLKFPLGGEEAKYSMLGLGDMIIPGAFVSLCLKFDIDRAIKNLKVQSVSQINYAFFHHNLFFYILGIIITYLYMIWFKHAQPALLYLVPAATLALLHPIMKYSNFGEIMKYEAVIPKKPTEEKETPKDK